jgi:hypothetical protein
MFRSLDNVWRAAPLALSPVSFTSRGLARRAACRIACFSPLLTSCPPRCSLHSSFLCLVDVLPTAPLAAQLVSFSCQRFARRAARCITCFFLLLTSCPLRRSLHRSFLSLADILPAVPPAVSLVCSSCRRLAHRAVRCIARFFLFLTSCPPCRSCLSVGDVLPAALLAASLVSFSCQRFACPAVRFIARFFFLSTSCPQHHSLYGSFLPLVDVFLAVPIAASLVSFSC